MFTIMSRINMIVTITTVIIKFTTMSKTNIVIVNIVFVHKSCLQRTMRRSISGSFIANVLTASFLFNSMEISYQQRSLPFNSMENSNLHENFHPIH